MTKLQDVQMKAATDPDFRAQLLADPKAALAGIDVDVPDDMQISVVEDSTTSATIAIPPAIDEADLSEDELASLAAGGGTIAHCSIFVSIQP